MKIILKPYVYVIMIILYGILFLAPFSGSLHLFDWDEIIFAEAAREMIVSSDYLTVTINYEPFMEKPPMFMWFQVISMKIFGINEFAARFPNVVCGIITLIVLFFLGRRLFNNRFGILWAVSFGTAILPFFYFRTAIIDPWFNLFIFLGFVFFIFYLVKDKFPRRHLNAGLSALFLGLAVLTKGPVALIIFVLTFLIFLIYKRGRISVKFSHVVTFIVVFTITGGSWFVLSVLKGNIQVVQDFIVYQAGLFTSDFAGHGGFPGFHFVILLFGVFPASVLMLSGFPKKREEDSLSQSFRTWMYILLFIVLLLFSIVETKLVHYSSLAYFPITFLSAWVVYNWLERRIEIRKWQIFFMGFVTTIIGAVALLLPSLLINPELIPERFSERFPLYVVGLLEYDAGWGIADYIPVLILLPGLYFALYLINKRDKRGIFILFTATLLFTFSAMLLFVPKAEKMLQRPAIDFIKEQTERGNKVVTLGFKSYAPYFYGEWMPGEYPSAVMKEVMVSASGEDPVYVVMKADNSDKLFKEYPLMVKLGKQGGFVFGRIDQAP
jgi:4-amino-4-deoxy-L-arabinose transferase-like glycosyltransferase